MLADRSAPIRMPHRPVADPPPAERSTARRAGWTPPSWEELVRDHSARVYRLAYRLTGNRPDAEDLTQDVFVRVFRSLHRFQPGTFEGWLHRITTNLFLDGARRRQKIRFDGLADGLGRAAAERLADPVGGSWPTPTSTTTSPPRWPPWRRSSAPPWCCATSRVSATRRSARCSTSRSAPSAAGSTAAVRSSGPRWTIAGRPVPGTGTWASRWRVRTPTRGADRDRRVWSRRGRREDVALRRARGVCARRTWTARSTMPTASSCWPTWSSCAECRQDVDDLRAVRDLLEPDREPSPRRPPTTCPRGWSPSPAMAATEPSVDPTVPPPRRPPACSGCPAVGGPAGPGRPRPPRRPSARFTAVGMIGYVAAPSGQLAVVRDPIGRAQAAFSSSLGQFPLASDSLGAVMLADAGRAGGATRPRSGPWPSPAHQSLSPPTARGRHAARGGQPARA